MIDERYYKGNVLNKWFAISSILMFVSVILTFIDDNDDEFKEYQKEFRAMEVETSKTVLTEELEKVKLDRVAFEDKLLAAQEDYNNKNSLLVQAQKDSAKLNGKFYKANAEFLAFKGMFDQIKFEYEAEMLEHQHHESGNENHKAYEFKNKKKYFDAIEKLQVLKLDKEKKESLKNSKIAEIKFLKSNLKKAQDELNKILKKVNITQSKIENKKKGIQFYKMKF